MKKVAVYNIKGGVGKTTTSVNLACYLAKSGLSVLLWDMDQQGGSSYFFNCQNRNNHTHGRLFDKYITIYDVIQSTDSYQIDVISNDASFSDRFISKASRLAAVHFGNHDLVRMTLAEVEDDYDVCIMDCAPGRSLLHDNIFYAADLLLIPNIPAPLSVYCHGMLMEELKQKPLSAGLLSFYNMVQAHKNLHKQYLNDRKEDDPHMLNNYVPFYSEIELITLTKESLFHQVKVFKANSYYQALWLEICERMNWQMINTTGRVVDIHTDQPGSCILAPSATGFPLGQTGNG